MKRMTLVSLLIFLPLALPARLLAEDLVKVIKEKEAQGEQLYVQNRGIVDATVSFKFRMWNAKVTPKNQTLVVGPGEKVSAFRISMSEAGKAWRYRYDHHYLWGDTDARHDDSYIYRLPFEENARFKVIQGFNGTYSHKGAWKYAIDWKTPVGAPVHAARGGLVFNVESGYSEAGTTPDFKNKANFIEVMHEDGTIGMYLHLEEGGAVVDVGEEVEAGELIGYSGNTGFSTRPHLHFTVYKPKDGWEPESIRIRFKAKEGSGIVLEKDKEYTAD